MAHKSVILFEIIKQVFGSSNPVNPSTYANIFLVFLEEKKEWNLIYDY